jgi:ABC-type multidrug transport system ATPase subunit
MIRIRSLGVTLAGRTILDGVDLDIPDGDTAALVGPNGAGKTTLLRCLLGLVQFRGTLEIDGVSVRRDPVRAKASLGYMPQVPTFCEETARGALAFVAALRGAPKADVDRLLTRVGLLAHAGRAVSTFSTGMRQRLSLAATLIGDPAVLVLDEPTASVDLRGQAEVVALLKQLRTEGKTIVMSSHRTEEVRALAHRIVVLDEGRVVKLGTTDAFDWAPHTEPNAARSRLQVIQ